MLTIVGVVLIVVSPLVGAVPGPGGIFVFAAGLALMLRNSIWAKKLYARFKRRYPKRGEWVDWSLRRRSALRRAKKARRKLRGD
ncbi:MAG: hypothetical protein HKN78_13235 [Sphingomonadaceae bacterium]|nr:hypothetical protein [Sphingomonadaceae bacterium]